MILPTVVEALRESRKNIKDGWTQGAFARTIKGYVTDPASSEAVKWCAYGAVIPNNNFIEAQKFLSLAVWQIDLLVTPSIVAWNDRPERTKEQVLAVYDLAIELARKVESNDQNPNAT